MEEGARERVLVTADRQICSECIHGALGNFGVFCTEFKEWVEEEVARECGLFEPVR